MSEDGYDDDFEDAPPLTPRQTPRSVRFGDLEIKGEGDEVVVEVSGSESEEESEEESEDSESDDTESDTSEDDESDDSDDSEDEEKVEVKVKVEGTDEVRGFCEKAKRLLKVINRCFSTDYGNQPFVLTYRDAEGDVIRLRGYSDLKYARKNHIGHASVTGGTTLRVTATLQDASGSSTGNKLRGPKDDEKKPQQRALREECKLSSEEGIPPPPIPPPSMQQSPRVVTRQAGSPRDGSRLRASSAGTNNSSSSGSNFCCNVLATSSGDFVWQKGALIGSGSFGNVYCAIDIITGDQIAVKEVSLASTSSSKRQNNQMKLLQREVSILSDLSHPNIIHYIGAEFTEGVLRIFLELADQGSIKDGIDEFGPFSEPLLRRYLVDIVCGLCYLHDKRLIHRDIKPSNLLLDKGVVKLADFGCSTYQIIGDGSSSGHGTMIGTTIYMSPEVMAEKQYGRKSDIWSLGVTMVEMATGKPPFRTAAAAIYSICVSKELPTLPTHMSADSHLFLSRCIVENAKQRASCDELSQMDFLCKVLTSQQSMDLTRYSRMNHMSSSVSLNPLSDFKPCDEDASPTGGSACGGFGHLGSLYDSKTDVGDMDDDLFVR